MARHERRRTFREFAAEVRSQERGAVPLKKGAAVRLALVYPNLYGVGMASLGYQTAYRLFNGHPDVRCERVFWTDPLPGGGARSLESGEPLNGFDVVGFSVSYELDLIRVVRMLAASGIPALRTRRIGEDPLVIAGGLVASLNPSPLLPFVDGLLVGEGEDLFFLLADGLSRYRGGEWSKADVLHAWAGLPGMFVPGLSNQVVPQRLSNLDAVPGYTPIVTPLSSFGDMFVVEVGRGCPRGCQFCAARKAYAPLRIRSSETLLRTVEDHNPGSRRIGLEGTGLSDHPELETLCRSLLDRGMEVAFSSAHPERITPGWIEIIDRSKVQSFSMAPETGSETLRSRIGKKISDESLRRTVTLLSESRITTLKLYFLIGLPSETDEDIEQIKERVREWAAILSRSRQRKKIRLSINSFVPKSHTDFERAPMNRPAELSAKRAKIREGLKKENNLIWVQKSVRDEIQQAVLSLGDARTGLALLDMAETNCSWSQALQSQGVDVEVTIHQERKMDTPVPWDFIRERSKGIF